MHRWPRSGQTIRRAFLRGDWPEDIADAIRAAYRELCRRIGQGRRRRRRALERDGRGPARRQLRRPAGDLPQHPRRGGAARRLPALLRLALHRPRDQLPAGQGLRSPEGRAVDRRAEDGALRPRRRRRHVLDRHRDRLRQGRADQRRLGPGRERRAGRGRSRRVPGLQAAAVATPRWRRSSRRSCGEKAQQDDLRERRRPSDAQRADLEGRARRVRAERRGDPDARALGLRDRGALRLPDGHGMGEGRRDRRAVHRAGAAGDGAVARARPSAFKSYRIKSKGPEARHRPQHRRCGRRRPRLPDRERARHRPLRRRRDPGDADDRSRTGCRS